MSDRIINGDAGSGRQKSLPVNYPANSHKNKARQGKTVQKVISGEAVQRKQTASSKFKEAISGDDTQSVASYILFDVVIPAAKSMLADATSQFIERLLFGESRRSSGGRQGYTSYNKMYNGSRSNERQPSRPEISNRGRATHNFGEVILTTRGEAEHVLDSLTALIDEYSVATVSDLYDLVGITGNFTDDKWGWYDLRGSTVSRIREGYLINLPQTQPIE